MIKSMTGYGRAHRKLSGIGTVDIALRTINGRFLESRFHLPRELSVLEPQLREKLSASISRGTVDVSITISNRVPLKNAEVVVNMELAKAWLKSTRRLATDLQFRDGPQFQDLLRNPEVFSVRAREELTETELKGVLVLYQEAIKGLVSERVREGKALGAELARLLKEMESLISQMEKMRELASQDTADRLRERLNKIIAGFNPSGQMPSAEASAVSEQKLLQEVAVLHDRSDITEELTRLKEHVRNYRKLLSDPNAPGKKLDFYAQELLREVNTIGSKSHHAKLTQLVVETKATIEKIREQVQNVE